MARHVCPTCGRDDFAREVDMKAHHAREHDASLVHDEDPRECPTCGEVFVTVPAMRAHHLKQHAESLADSRTITSSVREEVIKRDEGRCRRCDETVFLDGETASAFELHHLIPHSAGGPNHPSNLLTLCSECHKTAHNILREELPKREDLLRELSSIITDSS